MIAYEAVLSWRNADQSSHIVVLLKLLESEWDVWGDSTAALQLIRADLDALLAAYTYAERCVIRC